MASTFSLADSGQILGTSLRRIARIQSDKVTICKFTNEGTKNYTTYISIALTLTYVDANQVQPRYFSPKKSNAETVFQLLREFTCSKLTCRKQPAWPKSFQRPLSRTIHPPLIGIPIQSTQGGNIKKISPHQRHMVHFLGSCTTNIHYHHISLIGRLPHGERGADGENGTGSLPQ